jgi:hypothetical protein
MNVNIIILFLLGTSEVFTVMTRIIFADGSVMTYEAFSLEELVFFITLMFFLILRKVLHKHQGLFL